MVSRWFSDQAQALYGEVIGMPPRRGAVNSSAGNSLPLRGALTLASRVYPSSVNSDLDLFTKPVLLHTDASGNSREEAPNVEPTEAFPER
jgi:hypothetical protein